MTFLPVAIATLAAKETQIEEEHDVSFDAVRAHHTSVIEFFASIIESLIFRV